MTTDMTPDEGPETGSVYVPGTAGGDWSEEEVASTRRRIQKMITPVWAEKMEIGTANSKLGKNLDDSPGEVTENVIMRLVFHDCIPYLDGTGGCDGCLNWSGMYGESPSPNKQEHFYAFDPVNATDNKGLDGIAIALERIYKTVDWPYQTPSLEVSLYQSGKSRADLWQLAGLVALEQALERANRACDLDYHARQQVTLLEGREKCEIKLTKPLKFLTGRKDCISDDPEGRGYVTSKEENQPKFMGSANENIDYGRNFFNMDAEHFAALMGIHGAVHNGHIGLKYTWMGAGYISNVYFKQLANKPLYKMGKGGDLAFSSCFPGSKATLPLYNVAAGDENGNPQPYTSWRASCMMVWNTTMGGPCILRPTEISAPDGPYKGRFQSPKCVTRVEEDGTCVIDKKSKWCKNAYCDERGVIMNSRMESKWTFYEGPWRFSLPTREKSHRHATAWSNQFAFPWEVGMMYNFTVGGGPMQRPTGCEGLDEPFGSLPEADWPYRIAADKNPIWSSPVMKCGLNDYAPEGKPLHEIIDALASDNEYFAETFMDAWQMMTSNGYSGSELNVGPQNGWMGHFSLSQQGIELGDFEAFIAENAPVTFTDKNADPWVCGHRGHNVVSCGVTFSKYFEIAERKFDSVIGCVLSDWQKVP